MFDKEDARLGDVQLIDGVSANKEDAAGLKLIGAIKS